MKQTRAASIRFALLIGVSAALLTGAGAVGYVLAPAHESGVTLPSGWNLCRNGARGYSIGYPGGWYTTHLAAADACGFFDPASFQIPRNSDFSGTALEVHPSREPFARVLSDLTNPMFALVRSRRETSLGGLRAVRLETEATGEGLFDKGTMSTIYVIDRDGKAFLVQTTVPPGSDGTARRSILDRAAATLRFSTPSTAPVEGAAVVPPQHGLPVAVARKRAAIWGAARAHDYRALARLIDPAGFEYTFGGPVEGGPAAYWGELEAHSPERPARTLAAILELPYTKAGDLYVWPFSRKNRTYTGWRTGIKADGRWVSYVAGD